MADLSPSVMFHFEGDRPYASLSPYFIIKKQVLISDCRFCLLYHSKLTLYTDCCSELLDNESCTWLKALCKILSDYEKKQVCTLT